VPHVVEMKKITKKFPNVIANDEVDFTLEQGEIHVLLGENGAGKTTLMNQLYGLYTPTSGEIYIHGKKVDIKDPNVAIGYGIGMVHQHFMLVEPFTVAENIILGSEPKKGIRLDIEKAREDVREISNLYGLQVDPDAVIHDITVGMQQRVEILKALYRGAEILILDEPTAVLTPQEIEELGIIMHRLTDQGKSIILITHKLKEVMALSDRVTVIRRGKNVETLVNENTSVDQLAELMVGRKVNLEVDKMPREPGEVLLEVENLKCHNNRKVPVLKGCSFNVRAGEILAIAGVDGNGQTELVEVLTGLRKPESGSIRFAGNDIFKAHTKDIIEEGISHIPEDRQKRGLVMSHTLAENSILGSHKKEPFSKNGIMNYPKIHEYSRGLIAEFDVRTPSENVAASALSGGNQQKLIVARELMRDPMMLIASQPTRGVDVGAIEFIHKRLVEQRDHGKAVLLVSLELDEVMALADRIAVIYDGAIVGLVEGSKATERDLGILMAGGSLNKTAEDKEGDHGKNN
jgi:general nucleoside transport system ATP-binding protein